MSRAVCGVRWAVLVAALVLGIGAPASAVAMSAPRQTATATLSVATVVTATASNTQAITYEQESVAAFEAQLASHAVAAAEFNKVAHHLHLTLHGGRHLLVNYPGHQEPQFQAKIEAAGVPITIEFTGKAAGPVHHKLRYIAAALLLVVLVALIAMLIVRRRRLAGYAEHDEGPTPPAGSLGSPQ